MKMFAFILCALVAFPALARDPKQVYAFRKTHACPATGKTTGACPGYVVDHISPLCAGGGDTPENMQWQTIAASKAKDAKEVAACAFLRASHLVCSPA